MWWNVLYLHLSPRFPGVLFIIKFMRKQKKKQYCPLLLNLKLQQPQQQSTNKITGVVFFSCIYVSEDCGKWCCTGRSTHHKLQASLSLTVHMFEMCRCERLVIDAHYAWAGETGKLIGSVCKDRGSQKNEQEMKLGRGTNYRTTKPHHCFLIYQQIFLQRKPYCAYLPSSCPPQ